MWNGVHNLRDKFDSEVEMKQEKTKSRKRIVYYSILAASALLLIAATVLTVWFVTRGDRTVLDVPPVNEPADPPAGGGEEPSVPSGGEQPLPRFSSPLAADTITGYTDYNAIFDNVVSTNMIERHLAVDVFAPAGTDVAAMADGKVLTVSVWEHYDTLIEIEHDDGVIVSYRFVEPAAGLKEGDTVTRGQTIGTVQEGCGTEKSLGAHVHLEMTEGGRSVDPTEYLPPKSEEK